MGQTHGRTLDRFIDPASCILHRQRQYSYQYRIVNIAYQHLRPSGVLSCSPDGLELTPGFYPGSNEQHTLFLTTVRYANPRTHSLTRYSQLSDYMYRLRLNLQVTAVRLSCSALNQEYQTGMRLTV